MLEKDAYWKGDDPKNKHNIKYDPIIFTPKDNDNPFKVASSVLREQDVSVNVLSFDDKSCENIAG